MKIRQGRKNPHTLYLQVGDEPADTDPPIGLMIDARAARLLSEGSESMSFEHLNMIRMSARIRQASDS